MRRIYRRRPPHWLTLVVVGALVIAARSCWPGAREERPVVSSQLSRAAADAEPPRLAEGEYLVERVVDGDTIIVRLPAVQQPHVIGNVGLQRVRVRLLGVDAPESVKPNSPVEPFGPEASQFTKDFLIGGKAKLQFGRRRVDDYGRMLAFVFVENKMLNEELVRAGLARATTYPGDESPQMTRIRKAQSEARAAQRGIWSKR